MIWSANSAINFTQQGRAGLLAQIVCTKIAGLFLIDKLD
jgi:hypothetical protein